MNTLSVIRRPFLSRRLATLVFLLASLAAPAFAAESGFSHEVLMRGHILEVEADELIVCVGEEEGAQVGQELAVIEHRRVIGTGKKGPRFKRETVGRVRITSLFDGHYATAALVSGEASPHDTVELAR